MDKMVTKSNNFHNPICPVRVAMKMEIGITVRRGNLSKIQIITKSHKHCIETLVARWL